MTHRRPRFSTASKQSPRHEVTLVGVGESRPPQRDVLPLPRISTNVLVIPLDGRPSWRQSPTEVAFEKKTPSEPRRKQEGPFWATAETLTCRGMLIIASRTLVEHQWVVVEIYPEGRPAEAPPLRIKALVNFEMQGVGFGVRFIAMAERTREELEALTSASLSYAA